MPRMFRWIINDTRSLINDLRALARRMSTRWQWFRAKSSHRIEEASADLENLRRSAGTRTRMCNECRALIPVSARVCPECGEPPGRRVPTGVSRVMQNMLPRWVSVSSMILTLNIVLYLISLLVSSHLAGDVLPSKYQGAAWNIALITLGANVPALVSAGELWRLLTMVFLHGGLMHIGFNSWALLAVGPLIEEMYGSRKFLFMYILTGIGGSIASWFWRFGTWGPGIGASGALFGLIGIGIVWGWRRGGAMGEGIRGQMAQWAVYGLVMGFFFRFDNAAHIGGLITGMLLAAVISEGEPVRPGASRLWDLLAWASALLILGSFVMVGLSYDATLRLILGSF